MFSQINFLNGKGAMKMTAFFPLTSFFLAFLTSCSVEPLKTVPENFQTGQRVFHKACANCHGPDAMGDNRAPKLIQKKFIPENYSNEMIARIILNGSDSGAMPPQKNKVSQKEIKEIIKYLRHLQRASGLID